MQSTSQEKTSAAALASKAEDLFKQAATNGRNVLNSSELSTLLVSMGMELAQEKAAAEGKFAVDIRISLNNTREFGMVISAGMGGVDAELDESNFGKDRASVYAATALTSADNFFALFKRTLVYQKLTAIAKRDGLPLPDPQLKSCFEQVLALGESQSQNTLNAAFVLQSLELNPARIAGGLSVQTARCEIVQPKTQRLSRPIHKIDKLIHPASIGIIGVSASNMNFGRIILKNLLGSGYSKDRMTIIRAGETEIDGVKCAESLKALDHKLDLLIVAVAASAVYDLVDEIIETDSVESVMLIPGSLGETKASREPAAALAGRINAAHGNPGGGPIFLGANCLGVVSHPGAYDSWFIPLERLPKPQKKPERNSVMLSQSGAFMITRLSQNPWLDPRYMLALGNQTDLTHGDMLSYFADLPEIETIGIYIEGFKDGDGLDFAKAVRKAVLNGKQVVVYKSGKTVPGMGGVMGHTASIAGGPILFDSVVRQAGAIIADDFNSFDDLFYMAGALHNKVVGGNRLGAISGAGFEAVGMADFIEADNFAMEMGSLSSETVTKIEEILAAKKLSALVEVRNPIDINPGADDEAHLQISEAFLQDAEIDAVVVGLDPTAPSVRALEASKLRPGFDITDPKSTVHLMPPLVDRNEKPIVGIVDGGHLYDAMSAKLMDQGVCVFRNCARGTKALVRYIEARIYADALRKKQ
ncbi:MAG: CoA-binding protein [Sulfuritalea sp.]|nr:CoA-binding protein [Sulfuritalea sp.]